MVSLIKDIVDCSVGWVVKKLRDNFSDHLRDGDVLSRKAAKLITREMHGIELMLKGSSERSFRAAISHFRSSVILMYDAIGEDNGSQEQWRLGYFNKPSQNALALVNDAKEMRLNISVEQWQNIKDHLMNGREKAIAAFHDDNLDLENRIAACKICMFCAIILSADNPSGGSLECLGYLRDIHQIEPIVSEFKVNKTGGKIRKNAWSNSRKSLMDQVTNMNDDLYSFMKKYTDHKRTFHKIRKWPTIEIRPGLEHVFYDDEKLQQTLKLDGEQLHGNGYPHRALLTNEEEYFSQPYSCESRFLELSQSSDEECHPQLPCKECNNDSGYPETLKYSFDSTTGKLTSNTPDYLEPQHFSFNASTGKFTFNTEYRPAKRLAFDSTTGKLVVVTKLEDYGEMY